MKETDDYDGIMRSIQRKQRNSGILYALIPIVGLVCVWLFFELKLSEKIATNSRLKIENEKLAKEAHKLNDSIVYKRKELDSLKKSLKNTSEELLYTRSNNPVMQMQANQAKVELNKQLRALPPMPGIAAPEIVYYQRESDSGRVQTALNRLEFKFKIKASKMKYDFQPTNYINYGSGVDIKQVKIIALALMGQGIDLKEIKKIELESKKNVIEIGRKSKIFQNMSQTASEVNKLK